MNDPGSSTLRWFHRLLIWSAIAGLSALVFWYLDRPARQPAPLLSQDFRAAPGGERTQLAPGLTRNPAQIADTFNQEAPRRTAAPAYQTRPSYRQSPPSFKFLGKIREGDETTVLLYSGGLTLTVRGLGPVDDDYTVDAIGEAYLVLRHVSLGQAQIIQLTSVDSPIDTGWSADTTEQD